MYSLQSEKAKKVEDFGISGSEIKSSRGLMHLRRGDDEMRVAELTSAKAAAAVGCACNFNGLADPFCYALLNTAKVEGGAVSTW